MTSSRLRGAGTSCGSGAGGASARPGACGVAAASAGLDFWLSMRSSCEVGGANAAGSSDGRGSIATADRRLRRWGGRALTRAVDGAPPSLLEHADERRGHDPEVHDVEDPADQQPAAEK